MIMFIQAVIPPATLVRTSEKSQLTPSTYLNAHISVFPNVPRYINMNSSSINSNFCISTHGSWWTISPGKFLRMTRRNLSMSVCWCIHTGEHVATYSSMTRHRTNKIPKRTLAGKNHFQACEPAKYNPAWLYLKRPSYALDPVISCVWMVILTFQVGAGVDWDRYWAPVCQVRGWCQGGMKKAFGCLWLWFYQVCNK